MKRLTVLLIVCLLFCVYSLAGAQEIGKMPLPSSLFNVEIGRHIYYIPHSTLEVKGYDFSSKRSWGVDQYVQWQSPILDLTYTYSPAGLSEAPGAMLFSYSHRGDVELKLGLPVHPLIYGEWSVMDLHTWKLVDIEKKEVDPKTGKEITKKVPTMVHNRDSIKRIYGGAGLAFETPLIEKTLNVKGSAAYRFLNQRGWEASLGLKWTPKFDFLKGDPHILVGVSAQESKYSWGSSRSLGFMAEIAMTF